MSLVHHMLVNTRTHMCMVVLHIHTCAWLYCTYTHMHGRTARTHMCMVVLHIHTCAWSYCTYTHVHGCTAHTHMCMVVLHIHTCAWLYCTYTHVHGCTAHTHMCMVILHVHTCAWLYCTYTHVHGHTARTHMCMVVLHIHTCAWLYCMYICAQTCLRTYVHAHTHTHTHTHTYTHTHTPHTKILSGCSLLTREPPLSFLCKWGQEMGNPLKCSVVGRWTGVGSWRRRQTLVVWATKANVPCKHWRSIWVGGRDGGWEREGDTHIDHTPSQSTHHGCVWGTCREGGGGGEITFFSLLVCTGWWDSSLMGSKSLHMIKGLVVLGFVNVFCGVVSACCGGCS